MSTPRTVRVRARAGLVVDFHPETLTAPGGKGARLYGAGVKSSKHPGDEPVTVPLDHNVRRWLRDRDLEEIDDAAERKEAFTQSPGRAIIPAEDHHRAIPDDSAIEALDVEFADDSFDARPRLPGMPSDRGTSSTAPPGVPSSGRKQED